MEEKKRFIGIDLGKKTYVAHILNDKTFNGKTTIAGRESLYKKLRKTDVIALEVCSLAFVIEREIRDKVGCNVKVLSASKLAVIYASMKKTDKEDALKLARIISMIDDKYLPIVEVPTDKEWERRKILSENRELKDDRVKEINRLHAIFVSSGITDIKKSNLSTKKNRNIIIERLDGYYKTQAKRLLERLDIIDEQIAEIKDLISEECENDTKIELLKTIPGIGDTTALAFMAYVGNTNRFEKAKQVSNYLGLVPRVDISSTIVKYGAITKRGNSYLRSLLNQASWALVRSKDGGVLKFKYFQMTQVLGKSKKKAIIAIARKLAELMFTILKTGNEYQPVYSGIVDITSLEKLE